MLGRVYQRMCRLLAIVLSHSRNEKFDISDEELDKFVSEVNWSKIDKERQQRTIAEQFGVSNSTLTNCSFNISFAGNK